LEVIVKTLYIASLRNRGKTTLCSGLGRILQRQGRRVGYFKPVCLTESAAADDKDILFVRTAMGINEPAEQLSAATLTRADLQAAVAGSGELATKIQDSFKRISSNYDVVMVEGAGSLESDPFAAELCRQVTDGMDGRVIVVVGYSEPLPTEETTSLCLSLGSRLLGVIVNCVPASRIHQADALKSAFQRDGVPVLGVLPEDRKLMGISVEQVALALNTIIPGTPKGGAAAVESLMLGAVSLDPAAVYFGRMGNKCVIVSSARPDIQLAAMETDTRCLVVTGDTPLIELVSRSAERKGVPLIKTAMNTQDAISRLESEIKSASFNTDEKLTRLCEILDRHLDLQDLQIRMGLAA
jgi:BioD-like phosphotransacetylase family protein